MEQGSMYDQSHCCVLARFDSRQTGEFKNLANLLHSCQPAINCIAWIARAPSLRVPSGRGRLAMRFGGLAWLVYRGHCTQGCAHTEGALSGWVAKSSWEHQMAGYAKKDMQCVGTHSGGAERCITQGRQQQSAASHKSDGGAREHKQSHTHGRV